MKAESEKNAESSESFVALPKSSILSWDDALTWFQRQNPNMESNHPEELDWQAIKAQGRRY